MLPIFCSQLFCLEQDLMAKILTYMIQNMPDRQATLSCNSSYFSSDSFSSSCLLLFVLRFYGPVNPMGSSRARSVYLTTSLLGRLSPLSS